MIRFKGNAGTIGSLWSRVWTSHARTSANSVQQTTGTGRCRKRNLEHVERSMAQRYSCSKCRGLRRVTGLSVAWASEYDRSVSTTAGGYRRWR